MTSVAMKEEDDALETPTRRGRPVRVRTDAFRIRYSMMPNVDRAVKRILDRVASTQPGSDFGPNYPCGSTDGNDENRVKKRKLCHSTTFSSCSSSSDVKKPLTKADLRRNMKICAACKELKPEIELTACKFGCRASFCTETCLEQHQHASCPGRDDETEMQVDDGSDVASPRSTNCSEPGERRSLADQPARFP